ncbi:hypothetical protein Tco_1251726, partial [Tanacetum coccineum]
TLVDDEGKPLEKVRYSGDYDSEDEVVSVDDEMASFLDRKDGYGNNSLLDQWKESYENDDYEYGPYDDDMYEGQEIPDKIRYVESSCVPSSKEVVCLCNGRRCETHPHPFGSDLGPMYVPVEENTILNPRNSLVGSPRIFKRCEVLCDNSRAALFFNNAENWPSLGNLNSDSGIVGNGLKVGGSNGIVDEVMKENVAFKGSTSFINALQGINGGPR